MERINKGEGVFRGTCMISAAILKLELTNNNGIIVKNGDFLTVTSKIPIQQGWVWESASKQAPQVILMEVVQGSQIKKQVYCILQSPNEKVLPCPGILKINCYQLIN